MKIIVAGSRTFTDKEKVFAFLDKSKFEITEVVSGGANGVDKIGEEWAVSKGIPIKRFLPHYSIDNPKMAPLLRNVDMGNYADGLIAVWLNKSHGTEHMIKTMKKLGKKVEIMELLPEITGKECIKDKV